MPVNTILSGFLLPTPGVGSGIYDREGVAGVPYTRTYTLTRTSGGNNPRTFNLNWVGNDGTFSTAGVDHARAERADDARRRHQPVVGGHSAILNFDDPASPGVEFQTMNTVLVPYEFNEDNNFSNAISGSVGRGQQLHYFFRVPAGTPAFRVDLDTAASTTPGTGQIRFLRWHPFGLAIEDNAVSECYVPAAAAGCAAGSPLAERSRTHRPASGRSRSTPAGRPTRTSRRSR